MCKPPDFIMQGSVGAALAGQHKIRIGQPAQVIYPSVFCNIRSKISAILSVFHPKFLTFAFLKFYHALPTWNASSNN
jgi:hypothetical protein